MSGVDDFLFGTEGKVKKATTMTRDQEKLLALITQGLKSGKGPFADLFGEFDQGAFEEGVSKPLLQQFQEETLPQLQEKFIAGNQVLGSGMRRGQLKAATDLQTKLAQLMYEAKNQHKQNRMAGLNTALGTQAFENIYDPGKTGAVQGFIQGAGQGLGQAAGAAIAG
jgi:hypothetical protein